MTKVCVANCVKQVSLLVMLVKLNVRKSACVKHVVVLSSPSVNSLLLRQCSVSTQRTTPKTRCFTGFFYARNTDTSSPNCCLIHISPLHHLRRPHRPAKIWETITHFCACSPGSDC